MVTNVLVLMFAALAVLKGVQFNPLLSWHVVCIPLWTILGRDLYAALCVAVFKWMNPIQPVSTSRY